MGRDVVTKISQFTFQDKVEEEKATKKKIPVLLDDRLMET